MPALDLLTLNLVTIVNLLVAGVALLAVARMNTGCRGLMQCAVACGLMIAALSLYPFEEAFPASLLTVLTIFPMFAGGLLMLDGVRAFRELPRHGGAYLVASVLFAGFYSWFLFSSGDTAARTVLSGFGIGIPALLAGAAMTGDGGARERAIGWSTAACFFVHGLSFLGRGFVALLVPSHRFASGEPLALLNAATLNVAALGCAFGLSMATGLRLQRQTEILALYDPLTNLPNRRHFEEQLEELERNAEDHGRRIALIYCDLDGLKGINETLGHAGGDRALRIVAMRLRALLSADISLARIGGDEFVALIEGAPPREALVGLMDRLRSGVEGEVQLGSKRVLLRISCGLAIFPEQVSSAPDLLRLADAGMYAMKQRGRTRAPESSVAAHS